MINILVCGINGNMGKNVTALLQGDGEAQAVCGVDISAENQQNMPTYASFNDVKEKVDVVIDFSSPACLEAEMDYCIKNGVPAVIATTGYSKEQLAYIDGCAQHIAVFRTANFSAGINLLSSLVYEAAKFLGAGFDVEIVEKHHNKKADAPSGTALMLADSANSALGGGREYLDGRSGNVGKRGSEIGIHAVRGGTIVGEHEVMFCGEDEIITLSHSARSKKVFASGAIMAAKWLAGKPAGKYDMSDLLSGIAAG